MIRCSNTRIYNDAAKTKVPPPNNSTGSLVASPQGLVNIPGIENIKMPVPHLSNSNRNLSFKDTILVWMTAAWCSTACWS